MQKVLTSATFFALCLSAAGVQADELAPASPVVVTFEFKRERGGAAGTAPTTEAALASLNVRLLQNLGDGNGWSGVGQARPKLGCRLPKTFKGVPASGFTWVRTTSGNPETYTGTITKFRCE